MKPTPDNYAEALWLLATAAADGRTAGRYEHDHDAELGCYWFNDRRPRPNKRDVAYWLETGNLVREYLMLKAGAAYSETLCQGFIAWLKRSPSEGRQYEQGDDMRRAALVDWYLRVVR